ncbi:restriction endonuclease subunit S [Desulfovibrio sp. JY]|nr:restriction endonuclease subunit S [Desulfovibrio sp. JY]
MSKSQRLVSKRFDQIGELYSGATPSTAKSEYWEGDIVWITPNDLSRLRTPFLESSQKMLTAKGLRSCSAYILPAGSVVISSRAPIGYLAVSKVDYCTNQGCKSILLKEGYDSLYIYYNILHNIDKVKRIGEGTTFAEISKSALANIEFDYIVNTKAQSKIAEILSTVDKAIEQTEAIITKQQRIKTGLMQDLLTKGIDENGNIRSEETHEFKDSPLGRIPVEWEANPFQKIATYQNGKAFPSKYYSTSGVPLVRPGNLHADGFVRWDDSHTTYLPKGFWNKNEKYQVFSEEILMNLTAQSLEDNFLGRVCLTPDKNRCLLNQRIARVTPVECDKYYLFWILQGPHFRNHVDSIPQGSKVQHLYNDNLDSALLLTPTSRKEQVSIADILDEQSRNIRNSCNSLFKLQSLKTALMQDLLTGDVPVTNLLDEQSTI